MARFVAVNFNSEECDVLQSAIRSCVTGTEAIAILKRRCDRVIDVGPRTWDIFFAGMRYNIQFPPKCRDDFRIMKAKRTR